jgi:hypothetical protein
MIPKPEEEMNGVFNFGEELESWLRQRRPPANEALAAMVMLVSNIIACHSPNESVLLDGIKNTNDALRASATTIWVERQRKKRK